MNLFSEPLLPNYFDIEICIKKKKNEFFFIFKADLRLRIKAYII